MKAAHPASTKISKNTNTEYCLELRNPYILIKQGEKKEQDKLKKAGAEPEF